MIFEFIFNNILWSNGKALIKYFARPKPKFSPAFGTQQWSYGISIFDASSISFAVSIWDSFIVSTIIHSLQSLTVIPFSISGHIMNGCSEQLKLKENFYYIFVSYVFHIICTQNYLRMNNLAEIECPTRDQRQKF